MMFHIFLMLFSLVQVVVLEVVSSSKQTARVKSPRVLEEVKSYQDVALKIINFTVNGQGKGQTFRRLATFVDTFGSRIAGSQNLENSIDYMLTQLKLDGLQNVHGEDVMIITMLAYQNITH